MGMDLQRTTCRTCGGSGNEGDEVAPGCYVIGGECRSCKGGGEVLCSLVTCDRLATRVRDGEPYCLLCDVQLECAEEPTVATPTCGKCGGGFLSCPCLDRWFARKLTATTGTR